MNWIYEISYIWIASEIFCYMKDHSSYIRSLKAVAKKSLIFLFFCCGLSCIKVVISDKKKTKGYSKLLTCSLERRRIFRRHETAAGNTSCFFNVLSFSIIVVVISFKFYSVARIFLSELVVLKPLYEKTINIVMRFWSYLHGISAL